MGSNSSIIIDIIHPDIKSNTVDRISIVKHFIRRIILIALLSQIPSCATHVMSSSDEKKMPAAKGETWVIQSSTSGNQINEEFNFQWNGTYSPDRLWRRASWVATGNNLFRWENEIINLKPSYRGAYGGVLELTVTKGIKEGGEIQTVEDFYGYGYYEVRLKLTNIKGCCVAFAWKDFKKDSTYGAPEIDIEFLPSDGWSENYGTVRYTVHPDWAKYQTLKKQEFNFDPSAGFHRYGFLWTPDKISYTIDRKVVQTYSRPQCNNIPSTTGCIIMNAWTAVDCTWGCGPTQANATSFYDSVRYYPDATEVPQD